jgi:hypothetical protein
LWEGEVLLQSGEKSRRTGEKDLVDLNQVESRRIDNLGHLGADLAVHARGETVEPEPVDSGGQVETILERLDGAGGSARRGRKGALGVLNGKAELGLGTLVGVGSRLAAWEVKRDLGLLGELLGKVLEKLQELAARPSRPNA